MSRTDCIVRLPNKPNVIGIITKWKVASGVYLAQNANRMDWRLPCY
jgi:hypothetical protein